MNLDKLREWASDQNTIRKTCNHSSSNVDSSSSSTNHFADNAPAIRILKSQFGHPHVSLLSSIDEVKNKSNVFAASDHLDLPGGSSSHSDEPPAQMIDVVATDGDEFGDGNNNRKKNKKSANNGTISSLACPKYGPYTCPIEFCDMVFTTSQTFANHMKWNHHKNGKKQN
ncbi:hypothetical protein QL285_067117 [Trifolium repens]|nr:hypothetical protein QL285_067117 [Trifolium repens]